MGQKVRPTGFRTGIMVDWSSRWYASKQDFAELLIEDVKVRRFVKQKYGDAGISKIKIERTREKVVVFVYAARVDYGFTEAKTAQGHIGVKTWINNGDYEKPEDDPNAPHAQAGKVPKKPTRQGKR